VEGGSIGQGQFGEQTNTVGVTTAIQVTHKDEVQADKKTDRSLRVLQPLSIRVLPGDDCYVVAKEVFEPTDDDAEFLAAAYRKSTSEGTVAQTPDVERIILTTKNRAFLQKAVPPSSQPTNIFAPMNRNKLITIPVNLSDVAYLSCDNLEDAIRSLALAYAVDQTRIVQVFEKEWPDFLSEDEPIGIFQDNVLTWCMAQHMGCNDLTENSYATVHYHRGLFNGEKDWFSRGLLNSQEGAATFLTHLRKVLPADFDFDKIEDLSLSNIDQRTSGEFEWGGGPYAFDRLDDALSAQRSGLDYSAPEFLMGSHWEIAKKSVYSSDALRDFCKQNFAPVIVKFIASNTRTHAYVNGLWHYLHNLRFGYDLIDCNYAFTGAGKTVQHERILELITEESSDRRLAKKMFEQAADLPGPPALNEPKKDIY
jgi:hypothetical protein